MKRTSDTPLAAWLKKGKSSEDAPQPPEEPKEAETPSSSETIITGDPGSSTSKPSANADFLQPYQPVHDIPPPFQLKRRVAKFKISWYQDFPWLHYIPEKKAVFCFVCITANQRQMLKPSTKTEPAFTEVGYRDWNKAIERFGVHQKGEQHKEATAKIEAEKYNSIVKCANETSVKIFNENKAALRTICSSLRYLGRQGLAISGHNEADGNFMELLRFRTEDVPEMKQWWGRYQTFTSHQIRNEVIDIVGLQIVRKLVEEVKKAEFFSLIVDETTDVSTKEQMSLTLRFVDENLEAVENFMGFYEMNSTTGESLTNAILDVLKRFDLPVNKLRAQCYDGASNMSGKFRGVQTRIMELEPKAVYVHCLNHSLNLALQDSIRSIPLMRDTLHYVNDVAVLIGRSAKRLSLFEEMAEDFGEEKISRLKILCPTRWSVRVKSLSSIIKNYPVLLLTLEKLKFSNDHCSAAASGLLKQFESYETLFSVVVLFRFFTPCEMLASLLQSKSVTLSGSVKCAELLVTNLQAMLTYSEFNTVKTHVDHKAKEFEISSPTLPRRRKVPAKHKDSFPVETQAASIEERLWNLYKQTLEKLINAVKSRFDQEVLSGYCTLENILLDENEIKQQSAVEVLEKHEIDPQELTVQLSMFRKAAEDSSSVTACIRSFKKLHSDVRKLLSSVHKLLIILIVVPSSVATAERSFSLLRRLKTYLRSTMTQKRLNHLAIMHAYQSFVSDIDDNEIMSEFVSRNDSRVKVFGNVM